MAYRDRLSAPGPKKLLSLDGGGIRGLLTLEILAKLEKDIGSALGRPGLVLADYFDYIAGTSTGAIIAAALSLGRSVAEVRSFYLENGHAMFAKASFLKRFRYKYEDEQLAAKLKEVYGPTTTLGSDSLRTLLLVVMRNVSTDSPWPLSNNPRAHYNQADRADCNLALPLWQVVRASTAAPVYFPPEVVRVGEHSFVFVDGGVTMYNNPAFLLFLMATLEPYKLQWPVGEGKLMLVSVGTGSAASANADLDPEDLNLVYNATTIPSALMFGAANQQDTLCRVFGRCRYGAPVDRELGDLVLGTGPVEPRLFAYVRYDADLSRDGLDALGLTHVQPANVQKLDSVDHMDELREVGAAAAARSVDVRQHLAGFV
jgi:patatin-like phospholipase/acyl hydrolase